jgi:hypothetical protein
MIEFVMIISIKTYHQDNRFCIPYSLQQAWMDAILSLYWHNNGYSNMIEDFVTIIIIGSIFRFSLLMAEIYHLEELCLASAGFPLRSQQASGQ